MSYRIECERKEDDMVELAVSENHGDWLTITMTIEEANELIDRMESVIANDAAFSWQLEID